MKYSKVENLDNGKQLLKLLRSRVHTLAHAFVVVRREGFVTNVVKIDGLQVMPRSFEKNQKRVNVEVVRGVIKLCWVG